MWGYRRRRQIFGTYAKAVVIRCRVLFGSALPMMEAPPGAIRACAWPRVSTIQQCTHQSQRHRQDALPRHKPREISAACLLVSPVAFYSSYPCRSKAPRTRVIACLQVADIPLYSSPPSNNNRWVSFSSGLIFWAISRYVPPDPHKMRSQIFCRIREPGKSDCAYGSVRRVGKGTCPNLIRTPD
jgi:hypothetical protein